MVINGDVIFHQTYNQYTDWNKAVRQTTILKGNDPMKTESEFSYTKDGNLKSCSETGSLSWEYDYDQNGNIVNADFMNEHSLTNLLKSILFADLLTIG